MTDEYKPIPPGMIGIKSSLIVIDVLLHGQDYIDHVAKYVRPWNQETIDLVNKELEDGYIVNLRKDLEFGSEQEFDHRNKKSLQ